MASARRPFLRIRRERRRPTVSTTGSRIVRLPAMVDQPIAVSSGHEQPPPPASPRRTRPPVAEPRTAPDRGRGGDLGQILGYAVAVVPVALLGILAAVAPAFLAPLADGRVFFLGPSLGLWFTALVVALTAIGVLTVRFVRHPAIVVVVLFLTTSMGVFIITFAPATVNILVNLKT
jgi:hypothetical protein